MEEIAKLFSEWGLSVWLISILSFGLTQLVKTPIKKIAEKHFGDEDKKKVTKFIVFLPIIFAFIGAIVDTWIRSGKLEAPFVEGFDWIRTIKLAVTCVGLPSLAFSVFENFQADHDNRVLKNLQNGTDAEKEERRKAELEVAKQTAIQNANAKALAKAEKEQKALELKQQKLELARQKEIDKINKTLSALNAKKSSLASPNPNPTSSDENHFKQLT